MPETRRRSQNARRHGLAAKVRSTDPEWQRISLIAEAVLGSLPRTVQAWNLALVAASAQFELERIGAIRQTLGDAVARNDPVLRGKTPADEIHTILDHLDALDAEQPDERRAAGYAALRYLFKNEVVESASIFSRITPALRTLERYERRALSRRRRAFENITALAMSPARNAAV